MIFRLEKDPSSERIGERRALLAVALGLVLASAVVALKPFDFFPSERNARVSRRFDPLEDEPLEHRIQRLALTGITYFWIFCIGSTVGSFLNVVAYRMPRGEEVVRKPSHCPKCNTRIRLTDNIPVLGWLKLKGRCRSCGLSISPRYPLIELMFGLLITALAAIELLSGGANLPHRTVAPYTGAVFILWSPRWDLIAVFLYHAAMLAALTAASLIHWDRERAPVNLFTIAVAIGLLAPLFNPDLHPLPALAWNPRWEGRTALEAAADGVAGLLAGAAIGSIAGFRFSRGVGVRLARAENAGIIGSWTVVGAYLGWQATLLAGGLAAAWELVVALARRSGALHRDTNLPASITAQCMATATLFNWSNAEAMMPLYPTSTGLMKAVLLAAALAFGFVISRTIDHRIDNSPSD